MAKAPNRTRCPECNKLSERNFSDINLSWGDDMDFHTHRSRVQKVQKNGWDKTAAHKFYNRAIEGTKERINDETGRYKSVNINYENLARDGVFKAVSEEERVKRRESQRQMTEDAYNRANNQGYRQHDGSNLDIQKPKKQS